MIAIENVRLFEEVQARTAEVSEALQQQTATADVLKVISRSAFDLRSVLQTLIDSASNLCGAQMGGIYMLNGETYRLAAGYGLSPELRAHEEQHPNQIGRDSFVGRAHWRRRSFTSPMLLRIRNTECRTCRRLAVSGQHCRSR